MRTRHRRHHSFIELPEVGADPTACNNNIVEIIVLEKRDWPEDHLLFVSFLLGFSPWLLKFYSRGHPPKSDKELTLWSNQYQKSLSIMLRY